MSKYALVILSLCAVLVIASCGQEHSEIEVSISTPQPSIEHSSAPEPEASPVPSPTPEPTEEPKMNPDDVALLEGEWVCAGIYSDGSLIPISSYPALADLYDQVVTINDNGTYAILDTPYGERGSWIPMGTQAFADFEHTYMFSKEYTITYSIKDGVLDSSETESSGTVIACVQDANPDLLVWVKYGNGVEITVYQREDYTGGLNLPEGNSSSGAYSAPDSTAVTMGEKNALAKAKDYLSIMPFSYSGLVEQLEFEGYTTSEAIYGADNCGADWNEQAAKKARDYLDIMSFSRQGLIDQLEFEGFTDAQAEYGVTAVGY